MLLRRFGTSSLPHKVYDVIIVGGGLIGTTMACALGKSLAFKNCRIALIEGGPEKLNLSTDKFSNRVSAIAPGTQDLLTEIGVWKNIRRVCPVKQMKVWSSSAKFINFEGEVACIVENDEIINAITEELSTLHNVDVLYSTKIKKLHLNVMPSIDLTNDQSFTCKLLIGADGFNSQVRNTMGVKYINWNYNQKAIVATLKISDISENNIAYQKFLPDGPIAILPLSKDHSSLVWTLPTEKANQYIKFTEDVLADSINKYLHENNFVNEDIPFIKSIENNSVAAFPLGFGHAVEYVKGQAVIIGDAAHRVHPLAGQGVNIGFRDVKSLRNVLEDGLRNGRQIGNITDLKKYETESQKQNLPMLISIDLINRVYTSKLPPVQALGNFCIDVAAGSNLVKRTMEYFARN